MNENNDFIFFMGFKIITSNFSALLNNLNNLHNIIVKKRDLQVSKTII